MKMLLQNVEVMGGIIIIMQWAINFDIASKELSNVIGNIVNVNAKQNRAQDKSFCRPLRIECRAE